MRENDTAPLRWLGQVLNPVLLALWLSTDVVFLLLHLANRLSSSPDALLSLKTDGGYSELVQYIKEYWIAIAFFVMWWRRREGIYATWALLFAYLLCDDALALHERGGRIATRYWDYVPAVGLRTQDFGELSVFVISGSVLFLLIAYCYFRCSIDGRNVSRDLAVLLGLLVFFGVAVDMAHIALPVKGLGMVEDGGEMITMSFIASYAVRLMEGQSHVAGLLWRSSIGTVAGRLSRRGKPSA